MFKKAKQNDPFIYLKGVLHKDLVALLDYIYTGQAQVLAEDVDRFIQVGKDMQVKGLVVGEEEEVIDNTENQKEVEENKDETTKTLSDKSYDTTDVDESINSLLDDSTLAGKLELSEEIKQERVEKEDKNLDQLLSEISKKMEKMKDDEGMTMWKCTECGKMLKNKRKLQMHVEIHLEGYSHTCSHCGRVHKTRGSLQAHISVVHRGTK